MKTHSAHKDRANQQASSTRRSFVQRLFRRAFVREQSGAVAIEFALLALPFFLIIGAILETAVMFLSAQALDSAVENSVRLIRTGQAQTQAMTATGFRSQICGYLYGLVDCAAVKIRVTKIASFGVANLTSPIDETTGAWTVTEAYDAGGGSDIILVEAYYKWPSILDLGPFDLSSTADGSHLFAAVRVFRNEPFG